MKNTIQTGQPGPEKLYLRFGHKRDQEKLQAFYDSAKPDMDDKQREALAQKISSGTSVLIEDSEGNIQAAGLISPVGQGADDRHNWTLISDVHSSIRHFDLARVMVAAGTLNGFFVDPPEQRFVTSVPTGSPVMEQFARKNVGWTDLTPGENCTQALSALEAAQNSKWMECGPQQLVHAARMMQDVMDDDYSFADKATGREYTVDVTRCTLATSWRCHVDTLAGCHHDPGEKPDSRFGLGAMARSFRLGLG